MSLGDILRKENDISVLEEELRNLRHQLRTAMRKLRQRDAIKLELIDVVREAARSGAAAQPPLPPPPTPSDKPGTSVHGSILHTTDWQGGKRTVDYNLEVLEQRLIHMMDLTSLLLGRHGNPVDELTILLGGDMIEGVNIFPTQPFEIDTGLYEQVFAVVRLIRLVIDAALALAPRVRVKAKWGNHGRIGRFGELPDTDNLDRMAYRIAWERYENDPRVTWDIEDVDYVQKFSIGAYQGALLHGNEFHKSFSAQRVVQKLTAWQTMYEFGDTFIGHFHRRDCYGMPNGTMAYMTGSTESSNSYAADQLAATGRPSQRLHFVDPESGITVAEHILWL